MDQPERHLLLLSKITLELINVTTMLSILLRVLSTSGTFLNLLKFVFEAFARLEPNPIFWDGNYLLAGRLLYNTLLVFKLCINNVFYFAGMYEYICP